MATGPRYAVRYRRRREGKTNYRKRALALQSRPVRFIVRRSNQFVMIQLIRYEPAGDKTLLTLNSAMLSKKYGWKHSGKNVPACYLTGLLAGKLALKAGVKTAIADIGLKSTTKGASIFAVVKGAIDAGLKINFDAKVAPSEDRISGKHIASHFKNKITEDFAAIKSKIMSQ